jgi:chromosome segregation ATPase
MSSRFSYTLSGVAAAALAAGLAGVLYVQINTLAAERDGAARGLADERGRVGRLQADLDQLKNGKDAVERRAEKAEREGVEARAASAALEGQLKTAQDKLGALEKDRDGWRARAGEMETSLKSSKEALEAADKEKGSWRSRAEKAEQERSAAEGREASAKAQLQAEQQAHEKTRAVLAERDRDLAAARADVDSRDEEIRKLQGRSGEPAAH